MSDKLQIEHNTPEQVAYKLMKDIMQSEDLDTNPVTKSKTADRKMILGTYAACLLAVQNPSSIVEPGTTE